MDIALTNLELRQMIIWAENTISGGHFGDGNVIFPEESITMYKLKNSNSGKLDLSERDIRILIIWAENAIGKTLRGITSEEISLIDKLQKAQQDFQNQM